MHTGLGGGLMAPRVSIEMPACTRACGEQGSNTWITARATDGTQAFVGDLEQLKRRLPSEESQADYLEHVRERMSLAQEGSLPWDFADQMQIAPDVLEIKMPDWMFSGGVMQGRLYYSEPRELPGYLVALRFRFKRPGPIGLQEQDGHATEASDLLLEFQQRGFT